MRKACLTALLILFMLAPAARAAGTDTATVINSTLIIPIGEYSTSFTYAPVHVWQGETTVIINGATITERIYPTLVSIYSTSRSGVIGKILSITYSNGGTSIELIVHSYSTSPYQFLTQTLWDLTITYMYRSTVSGTMTSIKVSYWYWNPNDLGAFTLATKELYYNDYGTKILTYIYVRDSFHGESSTGYMSAHFYRIFSFTNFSLTGNIDYPIECTSFVMTYTISDTYYAETYHASGPQIFTIGTNTATVYFTTTHYSTYVFTTLSAVKYDDFSIARSRLSYLISYGTLGEITITGNSVIYGTYTLIFSSTLTGYRQSQINMIIPTEGTNGTEGGAGTYPVILQLPSFKINSYSVSGSIIYVDGTLYYPDAANDVTILSDGTVLDKNYTTVYPGPNDVQSHTWYPLGTRISYAITYIDISSTSSSTVSSTPTTGSNSTRNTATNVITNTHVQEFISTYSTVNSTVTRSETYLTYFSVKIPIEVDTIISSGSSIIVNDTYVPSPVTLSFSNGSPLFGLADVPTVTYNWTATGHITTTTTKIFSTSTVTIYIFDTLTTLPPYITYYSTPGTYTITKTYTVTYMDCISDHLTYGVYTVEVIYYAEINYTPAGTSTEESTSGTTEITGTSTSTAAANSAPFGLTLSSVNDTEITGPVARTAATLLWSVEAALFGGLLYSAYRYATAITEDERKKYLYRTLYVLASMLTIYVLPRALDWVAGL